MKKPKLTREKLWKLTYKWNNDLTTEQREKFNQRAKGKKTGYNLFLQQNT